MTNRPNITTIPLRVCSNVRDYSEVFLQGMLNRMVVSHYKYGSASVAYPEKVDALSSLNARLDKYRRTGNTEFLIDAANFAMIEFMHPSVPGASFVATDSDQSPGRVTYDGEPTFDSNEELLLKRQGRLHRIVD